MRPSLTVLPLPRLPLPTQSSVSAPQGAQVVSHTLKLVLSITPAPEGAHEVVSHTLQLVLSITPAPEGAHEVVPLREHLQVDEHGAGVLHLHRYYGSVRQFAAARELRQRAAEAEP